jgi:hypothetical protein
MGLILAAVSPGVKFDSRGRIYSDSYSRQYVDYEDWVGMTAGVLFHIAQLFESILDFLGMTSVIGVIKNDRVPGPW